MRQLERTGKQRIVKVFSSGIKVDDMNRSTKNLAMFHHVAAVRRLHVYNNINTHAN